MKLLFYHDRASITAGVVFRSFHYFFMWLLVLCVEGVCRNRFLGRKERSTYREKERQKKKGEREEGRFK